MLTSSDLDALIADTETEILSVIRLAQDDPTGPLYEMVRYHLGLDEEGEAGTRGKRLRPLLGLLAYESLTGDHRGALPGAAAVELGHNFSLVHDDIEDRDTERRHRATLWAVWGVA
ncbi:MAG: polyprenyl synthetase family protein, partial [Chloroflexota bacterium]